MNVLELITRNLEGNNSEVVVTVKVNEPDYLDLYVEKIGSSFISTVGIGLSIEDIKNGKDTTKIISKKHYKELEKAILEFNKNAVYDNKEEIISLDKFKTKSLEEKLDVIYKLLIGSKIETNHYIEDFDEEEDECSGLCDTCKHCSI